MTPWKSLRLKPTLKSARILGGKGGVCDRAQWSKIAFQQCGINYCTPCARFFPNFEMLGRINWRAGQG